MWTTTKSCPIQFRLTSSARRMYRCKVVTWRIVAEPTPNGLHWKNDENASSQVKKAGS